MRPSLMRTNGSISLPRKGKAIMQAGVAAVLLLAAGNAGSAAAFQNELLCTQALLVGDISSSLDELLFAAANIIGSQETPFRLLSPISRLSEGLSLHMLPPAPSYKFNDDDEYHQYDYDTLPISRTISLTKEEQDLFQLVKDVRDKYCPNTTIRVAGGWVRDKLLRQTASRDIDFVISDMPGSDFAKLFHTYLMEHNNFEEDVSYAIESEASWKEYGTRSKHLQTASLQFRGFWIDFCHLRFEKYSPGSRVPEETGMASAVEDAWRRDFTINSLFYNVNTNQVEDWTERGLQDLQLGIIATPIMPLATLLEDPLRVLRAIRFAAQLSFSMDPALKKAAMNQRVRVALQSKVSKDRMGNEIDSVFQTRDPTRGVQLLLETNLMSSIFPLDDRESFKLEASPFAIYKAGFRLLSRTQALVSRIFVPGAQWDESRRRYLWYAALFKPFCDLTTCLGGLPQGGKRSRRNGSIVYQLLTHGLKRPACDSQSIESIIKGADMLQTFLKEDGESVMQSLLETKVHFDTLSEHDPRWKHTADLRWMSYKVLKEIGSFWKESLILALAMSEPDLADAVQRYGQWETLLVDRLGLDDTIFDKNYPKPLLNGSQLQQRALPGVHGEGFKQIMEAQEEWQVRHGCSGAAADNRNNREAKLIDYLVQTFPEYTGHTL